MIRPLALVLIAASVAGAALAQERLVDAAKVFPMLDKFYSVPAADRSKLVTAYSVMTKDGHPATGLHLALVTGGKRTPMPIAADGRVERLPTPAELAAHAEVATDGPKGSFNIRLNLLTSIKPAQEISAADCALAVTQVNAAIQKAAGMMAMLAPKVKATTFPGAGSGMAVMADGKTVPLPLIKGAPAYDPEAIKNAKTIRLAKSPSAVSLE